jgi:hypothetical protein
MELFFQAAPIASVVVGVGLILYSVYIYSRHDDKSGATGYFETANTLKFLESSLGEIDKTMDELNETSQHIFTEMEEKYKELLLLYSLIEEKKKELAELHSVRPTDYRPGTTFATPDSVVMPPVTLSPVTVSSMAQTSAPGPQVATVQSVLPGVSTQSALTIEPERKPQAPALTNIGKVRQLQQEGLSLEDTAKKLGIGKGEVKLMYDLGKIK